MRMTMFTMVVAVTVAALAVAQFGPGGRGGGAGMLLGNSGVQKELKLTDEQQTKVKEFLEKTFAKMGEAFEARKGGDQEKAEQITKAVAQDTEKFIKDTLKEDQIKRLKQIQHQVAGPGAFTDEEVANALKLTDEQKEDIKKLNEELGAARKEAFQGAFGDREKMAEARKKMENMNKEAMTKITKMLTPEQKKAWKEVTGEPFDFKPEGFGPGGGFGKGGKGRKVEKKE
jgi:Spy/CpxP family protein refolding chaperone